MNEYNELPENFKKILDKMPQGMRDEMAKTMLRVISPADKELIPPYHPTDTEPAEAREFLQSFGKTLDRFDREIYETETKYLKQIPVPVKPEELAKDKKIINWIKSPETTKRFKELIDASSMINKEIGAYVCEDHDKYYLEPVCVGQKCSIQIEHSHTCPGRTIGSFHTHPVNTHVTPSNDDVVVIQQRRTIFGCIGAKIDEEYQVNCHFLPIENREKALRAAILKLHSSPTKSLAELHNTMAEEMKPYFDEINYNKDHWYEVVSDLEEP